MSIFQTETEDIIERIFENLIKLEKKPDDRALVASLYRDIHSLKGAVRMVGFSNFQDIIHRIEDIFDIVKADNIFLDSGKIGVITKAIELVSGYIHESVKNSREIIDENYTPTISALEYIRDIDLKTPANSDNTMNMTALNLPGLGNLAEIAGLTAPTELEKTPKPKEPKVSIIQEHQEEINFIFNHCFELIDGIVPEEESQETVIIKEEVEKIYEYVKDSNFYEVKTALEDIIAKLDFVLNATNIFTISEILEMRDTLSSAAAKFNTLCIDSESSGLSLFDISEKI